MSLQAVIESTDGLNETLIPFYTEQDGKFYLQIEGVREHPEVANLRVAYDRRGEDLKDAKAEAARLKAAADGLPDDFDPEKWEKLKDGKPDEAALIALRQTLEAERDAAIAERDAAKGAALKNAVDRDLAQSLSAVGVTDAGLLKGATAILGPNVKVDESGNAVVDTDMGPMALAEHVKRWAAGDGKAFVDPGKGGGGKGGEGGGGQGENPWKAENRNLTRQAEILRTDPAQAAQLKAAAGDTT